MFKLSPIPELTPAVMDIPPLDWAHFRRAFNDYNNTFNLVQDDLTFKQNNPMTPKDPMELTTYNARIGSANLSVGALGIAEHTLGTFVLNTVLMLFTAKQLKITSTSMVPVWIFSCNKAITP